MGETIVTFAGASATMSCGTAPVKFRAAVWAPIITDTRLFLWIVFQFNGIAHGQLPLLGRIKDMTRFYIPRFHPEVAKTYGSI
jgi:hypothetical protein